MRKALAVMVNVTICKHVPRASEAHMDLIILQCIKSRLHHLPRTLFREISGGIGFLASSERTNHAAATRKYYSCLPTPLVMEPVNPPRPSAARGTGIMPKLGHTSFFTTRFVSYAGQKIKSIGLSHLPHW